MTVVRSGKIIGEYSTRKNFLPNEGYIYVDTCALDWVGPKDGIESRIKSLDRIESFHTVFERRGRVFTTPLILEEIGDSIDHYMYEMIEIMERNVQGKWNLDDLDDIHEANRFYLAHGGIYDLLKQGMEGYSPRTGASRACSCTPTACGSR